MIAQQTIDWKPFSDKHKKYIHDGIQNKMSVAEGAIRSGKTIDNCIIAALYLETCPDKIHLASGSTQANAKLNIGACNGFGLEHLFRGRCRWGAYRGNDCLYIQTQTGQKVVIFAGGGLANSYKKILGNSYGLWIATEINQHYDSDDSETSFIKVAFGRQAAAIKPMVLWDLNPSAPRHPIYENYIDRYKSNYLGGYNYQHFTIDDNLSISDRRKQEIASQYNKDSVWYKRDILGLRCIAEGLCYPVFADNPNRFLVNKEWLEKKHILKISCGVDFGGDSSATTFVASAIINNYDYLCVLKSKRIKKRLDSDELGRLFTEFATSIYKDFLKPFTTYCDSAESVLIHTLEKTSMKKGLQTRICNALKISINERIKAANSLIAQDRLKVLEGDNKDIIESLCNATWDESKQEQGDVRLDVVSFDNPVDICDAFEYSFEGDIKRLIRHDVYNNVG